MSSQNPILLISIQWFGSRCPDSFFNLFAAQVAFFRVCCIIINGIKSENPHAETGSLIQSEPKQRVFLNIIPGDHIRNSEDSKK